MLKALQIATSLQTFCGVGTSTCIYFGSNLVDKQAYLDQNELSGANFEVTIAYFELLLIM